MLEGKAYLLELIFYYICRKGKQAKNYGLLGREGNLDAQWYLDNGCQNNGTWVWGEDFSDNILTEHLKRTTREYDNLGIDGSVVPPSGEQQLELSTQLLPKGIIASMYMLSYNMTHYSCK